MIDIDLMSPEQVEADLMSASDVDVDVESVPAPYVSMDWPSIRDKPFETVDQNTLIVQNNEVRVNTADEIEADNTRPVTSSSVFTLVGNINILLEDI